MMYYDFEVGDKVYQLRLTTRSIVRLEEKIGCNPLAIFGKGDTVPTVSVMVSVLWAALQSTTKGITEAEAYNIFDSWIEEGHTIADFIYVILEIYKVSGLIKDEEEKN